jgi:hypothetical protein
LPLVLSPEAVRRFLEAVEGGDGLYRLMTRLIPGTGLPRSGEAVGEGASGAEAGAQVDRPQRLAQAGVAFEQRRLAQGQPARPQPVEGARRRLTGGADIATGVDRRGHGHAFSGRGQGCGDPDAGTPS